MESVYTWSNPASSALHHGPPIASLPFPSGRYQERRFSVLLDFPSHFPFSSYSSGEKSLGFFFLEVSSSGSRYSENVAVFTYVTRNGLLYLRSAKMLYMTRKNFLAICLCFCHASTYIHHKGGRHPNEYHGQQSQYTSQVPSSRLIRSFWHGCLIKKGKGVLAKDGFSFNSFSAGKVTAETLLMWMFPCVA